MKSLDRELRPRLWTDRVIRPPNKLTRSRLHADPNIVQYRGYVKTTEFLYIILE